MSITYGASGQPAQSIFNYDALISTSIANYSKTLADNVSTSNLFFRDVKEKGLWTPVDGGLYIAEDLMYGLAPTDSYDGYDELPLTPTEGITQAQYQWSQSATPVSISEKERKQNKHRIIALIPAKLQQSEISAVEFFSQAFIQGSLYAGNGTDCRNPYTSPANGSVFVNPLPRLVCFTNTASLEVGGINQSTQTWWRNQVADATSITSADQYLQLLLHLKNDCSKGPGGPPNLGWSDQISWELLSMAYYQRYRTEIKTVEGYPWPVIEFQGMKVTWDQYMINVGANSGMGSTDTSATGKGSFFMLTTKFFKVGYESETNFVATDFERPVNQDAKYKHILWMGQTMTNNRRKHGVMGNIPRSLTIGI